MLERPLAPASCPPSGQAPREPASLMDAGASAETSSAAVGEQRRRPFIIKILREPAELIQSYRLRYRVFDELGYLRQRNSVGLEIDEYDRYAIPFGAIDPFTGELIGTLRLIETSLQTEYLPLIQGIVEGSGDAALRQVAFATPERTLPSITSDWVEALLGRYNRGQQKVHELSRTIVHPSFRKARISRALMEFGLAYAVRHVRPLLIGACIPQHVAMYAKYGYEVLPGSMIHLNQTVGQIASTVVCDTVSLPEPTRTHVALLLERFAHGCYERLFETEMTAGEGQIQVAL